MCLCNGTYGRATPSAESRSSRASSPLLVVASPFLCCTDGAAKLVLTLLAPWICSATRHGIRGGPWACSANRARPAPLPVFLPVVS